MSRKTPKFEALVVNAIRRLQAAQGSTANEIANYLSQEYDVSGPEIRRQIQLTIKRGLDYGILQKSKRGYTTCDRNIPETDPMDEDCFECRTRRRRGGDTILSRRGRSKRRGGYRALGKYKARHIMAKGSRKNTRRKQVRRVATSARRGVGMTRKARTGWRAAAKANARKTASHLQKAKQKQQSTPQQPPQTTSNTSTNRDSLKSSSKSPVRNASETNQDS